jgi:hypothetical protein
VFVTAGMYTGNLGGIAGGNAKCQTEAANAGLPGTYKAWLSTSNVGENPATSFTQSNLPYVTPDTNLTQVAPNWTAFASATHSADINYLATGQQLGGGPPQFVWTGTTTTGTPTGNTNHCSEWTSNSITIGGTIGDADSPSDGGNDWTYDSGVGGGG